MGEGWKGWGEGEGGGESKASKTRCLVGLLKTFSV